MDFRFEDFEVRDDGIALHFVSPDPGPGRPSDYYVLLTDAELAGVNNQSQLRTLVTTKLQRKIQAQGIAAKLTPFVGQVITL